MGRKKRGTGTSAVHDGEPKKKAGDAVTNPIHCTATYVFEDTDELHAHFRAEIEREEYGRYGNPTVRVAERKLAELDHADDAALFSSGMAAITSTLMAMLKSGHHVV
ncbi:MAG: PLP-dependent transferase, partial [Persicimonas sp.]